jgi:hypothetical protein
MRIIYEKEELERIKSLYYLKGLITEDSIWGIFARKARSWSSSNEDDIARLFKTTEVALAKSIDDIVNSAIKAKNIATLDDIQLKLLHAYNPSGLQQGVEYASANTIKTLNGYAKSKGRPSWKSFRDEVQGIGPKPQSQPQAKPNADHVQVRQNPVGGIYGNPLSGKRISNRSFVDSIANIDFNKIKNWGGSIDNFNKVIAKAIKTGDYSYVSSGGFEKFGITNFREFLKNNISSVNEVIPETGRWSVNFK